MKLETVGTVVTSTGLIMENPIIKADFSISGSNITGNITAYISLFEEANGAFPSYLREYATRETLHSLNFTMKDLVATDIGQTSEEIAAIIVKAFVDEHFNIVSTPITAEIIEEEVIEDPVDPVE